MDAGIIENFLVEHTSENNMVMIDRDALIHFIAAIAEESHFEGYDAGFEAGESEYLD